MRICQSNSSRCPSFAIWCGELPWAIRVRRNEYENVASDLLLVWNMMSDFLPFCCTLTYSPLYLFFLFHFTFALIPFSYSSECTVLCFVLFLLFTTPSFCAVAMVSRLRGWMVRFRAEARYFYFPKRPD